LIAIPRHSRSSRCQTKPDQWLRSRHFNNIVLPLWMLALGLAGGDNG
jgi:hypothetical protein